MSEHNLNRIAQNKKFAYFSINFDQGFAVAGIDFVTAECTQADPGKNTNTKTKLKFNSHFTVCPHRILYNQHSSSQKCLLTICVSLVYARTHSINIFQLNNLSREIGKCREISSDSNASSFTASLRSVQLYKIDRMMWKKFNKFLFAAGRTYFILLYFSRKEIGNERTGKAQYELSQLTYECVPLLDAIFRSSFLSSFICDAFRFVWSKCQNRLLMRVVWVYYGGGGGSSSAICEFHLNGKTMTDHFDAISTE